MLLATQIIWLFVLGIPIACITWTVTHEEVLREPREYCKQKSQNASAMWQRKFFYLFTCEYCFSHYVAAFFLIITGYHLLYADWRGYLVAFFSLPFVANLYLGIFGQLKLGVRRERAEIKTLQEEGELKEIEKAVRQQMRGEAVSSLRRPAA